MQCVCIYVRILRYVYAYVHWYVMFIHGVLFFSGSFSSLMRVFGTYLLIYIRAFAMSCWQVVIQLNCGLRGLNLIDHVSRLYNILNLINVIDVYSISPMHYYVYLTKKGNINRRNKLNNTHIPLQQRSIMIYILCFGHFSKTDLATVHTRHRENILCAKKNIFFLLYYII
jgi:hypothetical protein